MRLHHYATRAEWLAGRRLGLGGSDVPAILGVSRYRDKTPLAVWESKVFAAEEPGEESYTFARGHYMEAFIAKRLQSEANVLVALPGDATIAESADAPCLRYSPDGFVWENGDRSALCEFKSRLRDSQAWEEEIPADVVAQVQHGMDVCDLPRAIVACDTGNELRWAWIDRDPKWATEVRPRLIAWWQEYVVGQVPPPPTSEDADVLARIYPRQSEGTRLALPGDFMALRDELNEAEAVKSAAEAKINELKNRVRAAIGEAETAVLPDGSGWTWKTQQRKAYTVEAGESRVLRAFAAKKGAK